MNHLALLIPGLDRIGGAERQAILLAKGLARRGWRVSAIALSGSGGDAAAELTAGGAGFLSLSMRRGLADPGGWIRFHRWLRKETPDVVHAHLPHAAWLGRWSRLAAPVRALVDTVHSCSTGSPGRRLGYRLSAWLPDAVTAVSQAAADSLCAAGMADSAKLIVLPNGIEPEAWRPDAAVRAAMREEHKLGDRFVWLAAGRLEPVKNYPALLRAFAGLAEPASLVIAGDGALRGELEQLSRSLGVQHRVRFLGFEPEVLRWMRAADGFVLSSLWEGLPMALLEAAACALPAVATDVPGTRETVVPGETGLLASSASPTALQEAMSAMMRAAPEELQALGERARQRVVLDFSLEAVLDRWEALYAELLWRNPGPRRWARRL